MTGPPPGGSSSPPCASSAPTPNAWPCRRPRPPTRSGTPAPPRPKIAQARQALGHRVALLPSVRDRRPAADQPDAGPGRVPGRRRPALASPTTPPTSLGPRAAGIRDRRNTTLRGLFTDADTQQAVRGTRWAGLQAITEYLDHHAPAKDDDRPGQPGAHLPRARQSASSAPTTCSPPTDRADIAMSAEHRDLLGAGLRRLPTTTLGNDDLGFTVHFDTDHEVLDHLAHARLDHQRGRAHPLPGLHRPPLLRLPRPPLGRLARLRMPRSHPRPRRERLRALPHLRPMRRHRHRRPSRTFRPPASTTAAALGR